MKATAKYRLDTPDADDTGALTTANLDKSEFISIRKRNMFKCPENDSIFLIISSPTAY